MENVSSSFTTVKSIEDEVYNDYNSFGQPAIWDKSFMLFNEHNKINAGITGMAETIIKVAKCI